MLTPGVAAAAGRVGSHAVSVLWVGVAMVLVMPAWVIAAPATHRLPHEPQVASALRLFEAGKYDAAIELVERKLESGEAEPEEIYWAGQSLSRLGRPADAAAMYERLCGEDASEPWDAVGRSAAALERSDRAGALEQATRAVQLAPGFFYAQFQLGYVQHQAQQWAQAAAAFSRAAEIDGQVAYAHYYAGTAYNRLKRIEPMAVHFQRFLDLAPEAPERESVLQILRVLKMLR